MRIDYLKPVTDDIEARAEVAREGNTSAVVDIDVTQDGEKVASVRGVYKIGIDESAENHWERGSHTP